MTLAKRFVSVPTAGGKKNDDAVETSLRTSSGANAMPLLTLRGPRKKRILLSLLALVAVYFFIKYLPTDIPPVSRRYDSYGFLKPGTAPNAPSSAGANDGEAPPRPQGLLKERYFDGPVKFYHLTSSLYRGIAPKDNARNVLFGISNIKSGSNVLPMACEMSRRNRNRVHVALLGRHDVSIETVKDIYGTSDLECPVSWHDGRPDYAAYSSDQRMETSVRAALSHLLYYLKPHAIIIDDAAREDHYFAGAVKQASGQTGTPVITLPDPALERLGWLCELDSASLGNWDQLQVEILVQGSSISSASFIRLLKSIANADYTGAAYPRLTIELPEITDPPTLSFLSNFRWPPGSSEADSKTNVRRRLSSRHLAPIEASLRTVESFYPVHADRSHLLVLTPDAELSSTYFCYLKYLLLEYRYSSFAMSSESASKLMGISLESPSALLNGTRLDLADTARATSSPLFLWQAPNSHAALYFGDVWVEFHSFLSHRLATAPASSSAIVPVLREHPAWLPYVLELARSRAYYMLYPHIKPGGSPLVTIHNDLYHVTDDLSETNVLDVLKESRTASAELSGIDVLTDELEHARLTQPEAVTRNTEGIASILLRAAGNTTLPQLQSLPHLSYDGVLVDPEIARASSISFADHFSLDLGGCNSLKNRAPASAGMADDLFCDEDRFS